MESQEREMTWATAIRKGRMGDRLAYELFLREFANHLRWIIRCRLQQVGLNSVEAEDLVQEVLIAVHSMRNRWNSERPLLPWLNAIVRYKIIDYVRRFRKEMRVRVYFDDDEWSKLPALEHIDYEHVWIELERSLYSLPAGQQLVARTLGVDGDSLSEAAEKLGMTEGTVRVAFHRAINRLLKIAKGES